MTNILFRVADDFSLNPFGRFKSDGGYSAEKLRDDHIIPLLIKYDTVEVNLDNLPYGVGANFIEETFGGLVRKGFSLDFLKAHLAIVSEDDSLYVSKAWEYIEKAVE